MAKKARPSLFPGIGEATRAIAEAEKKRLNRKSLYLALMGKGLPFIKPERASELQKKYVAWLRTSNPMLIELIKSHK